MGRPHGAQPLRRLPLGPTCAPGLDGRPPCRGPRHFIHILCVPSPTGGPAVTSPRASRTAQGLYVGFPHLLPPQELASQPSPPAGRARARTTRRAAASTASSRDLARLVDSPRHRGGGWVGYPEISMVHLPGSGKRRAAPAPAVKVEEGFGGGDAPPHKRVKAAPPPPPPQDMSCDVLDEPSPLGLRLRKSPSLLDLIQMKLSQAKSAREQFDEHNTTSETPKKKDVKSGAPTAGERMKASNFHASVLKIGSWEYISRYEGDLVAKCYFAKHKLVWEVLHDGLKSKIEIQWSDITALKATYPENEQEATLDLVLARPPLFFKETDPQPRKHTLWQAASDFTDGQASLNRKHTLQCQSSLLSKNFEKLTQCDQRLYELSLQPDAMLETPGFEPKRSIFENPNDSKDCLGFNGLEYEREASLPKFNDPASPCVISSLSKNVGQPINIGSGATDLQGHDVPQGPKNCNQWNQLKVPGLRASISVEDLVNHLGDCRGEHRSVGDPPLANNEGQSKEVLEGLVQYLFSDTQGLPASDDKYFMARVDSLYSLLEKDTAPSTIPKPECSGSGNIGVIQVDSDGSDEELNSSLMRNSTHHLLGILQAAHKGLLSPERIRLGSCY